jgi:two-component system response regulator VicR
MAYKILVVDDDRDIVETLKNRLEREKYEVVVAFDGEEAITKVKEADPDIVLLDLVMPKLNGFEVLKEIREKYKEKWRPVIVVSAQDDLESFRKSYSLEADHYLTKPCTMEHILAGIKTMISLIPIRDNKE